MAQHGLGILEEQLTSTSLSRRGDAPTLDDVHNISTTVTELPPHLLEALKTPEVRVNEAPPRPRQSTWSASSTSSTSSTWKGGAELIDLSERSDADEAMTLELDTVMLGMALLPPVAELPQEEAPPQTIELHVVRRAGPLAALETELSGLPRPWLFGGAAVAAICVAGVLAMFCWTLAELVL